MTANEIVSAAAAATTAFRMTLRMTRLRRSAAVVHPCAALSLNYRAYHYF